MKKLSLKPLVSFALNLHFSLYVRGENSLFNIIRKAVVLYIKIKNSCSSVRFIFNVALSARLFLSIRHKALQALKFSIVFIAVNPAWASPVPPYEDEYVSQIYFCKREFFLIKSAPFKGFYIRCEDTDRYGEYVRAGQLDKARALLQPGRWP